MKISASSAYKALKSKGIDYIYHANSVITSCQFLRKGALISRGTIDRNGMYQTPQNSDRTDQEQGVWFDVFADTVDIHERASRENIYGPVLFVLKTEIIKEVYTGGVWVTRTNPTYWKDKSYDEKWFTSSKELEKELVRGTFEQMIVFRHCGGELPIKDHLEELILDDPDRRSKKSNIDYYSMAYGALRLSATEGEIDVMIQKRKCAKACKCKRGYAGNIERTRSMYFPKV